MRIKVQGFLGKNHSWAIVNQNIARALIKKGHDVEMVSTDGLDHFPDDLNSYLKPEPTGEYDCQISYTAMINFGRYLANGSKNRFGIWCFETDVLPQGFAKHYKSCDKILPPSNFAKDIFVKNKIPEEHVIVVPHGIEIDKFSPEGEVYNIRTEKKRKILVNIAQPHIRKNLPGLLESIGRAFTSKDDVCIILKVATRKPNLQFDVSFDDYYSDAKKKFPQYPETKILSSFIPDIASLYRACDVVFSMTHSECFFLPALEGLATRKIVVCPKYGGQLDFLTENNSMLIDGKEIAAPRNMQYWSGSPYAKMFNPSIDDAAEKLIKVINNYDELHCKYMGNVDSLLKQYTWDVVVDKIIGYVNEIKYHNSCI
jgi:O-antigen biosynthesis alpha-1,2-mannosyltransferase